MKVSPYCYPKRDSVEDYINAVETIKDTAVRRTIKLICCCGFRINEILNSYLFFDAEGTVYVRAPASKTSVFSLFNTLKKEEHIFSHNTQALGKKRLKRLINQKIWKSAKLENIFNLNIDELMPAVNPAVDKVNIFFYEYIGVKYYNTLFHRLKKENVKMMVNYRPSKLEASQKIIAIPSYHFYRKLFAAHYTAVNSNNVVKTVDYMKWRNLHMILHYVKDY